MFPIERRHKRAGVSLRGRDIANPSAPLVLVAASKGGLRLTALNPAGLALGLLIGEPLADARARVPHLQVREAAPDEDCAALRHLSLWATRFTPWAAPYGEDWGGYGLTLDITGVAHLFGGEEMFAAQILDALKRFGISAQLAIAATPGAAYAFASASAQGQAHIIPDSATRHALEPLPVAVLRIDEAIVHTLQRFGLKRIGDLLPLPRAALTARFGPQLLQRLDQALNRESEALSPLMPPPRYRALTTLAEPVAQACDILVVMKHLSGELAQQLDDDGMGARALRLVLYRVDGVCAELWVRLARPSCNPAHHARLFALRLDGLHVDLDAGFGFDAAALEAHDVEELQTVQTVLDAPDEGPGDRAAVLIDHLGNRLGLENVWRLHPHESHIPERAVVVKPALQSASRWPAQEEPLPRPILMLPAAEPAEVLALMPEGPPRQFRWRGVRYGVAHAEGPERICPEWWHRATNARTRDYYIVEDNAGRRFWIYREGLYGEETTPRWYVHGVFA